MTDEQTQADVRLHDAWEEIWHAAEDAEEEELVEVLNAIEVLWALGAPPSSPHGIAVRVIA